MKRARRKFWTPWRGVLAALLALVASGVALWLYLQGKNVAVLNPKGIVATNENHLIMFTLMLSVIVVVPVFIMLFAFAFRYRESNHDKKKVKYSPELSGNRWVETLWWGIPIIIIGILCVVTWVSTHQLDPYKPLNSNVKPLRVQVVALPWRWLFIYPDYHIASVNELKIPVGTPVNFTITADAPMSAFWIPNLGTQVYAMTGMTSQLSLMADQPGTYRGSNSNISGTGYADMSFDVDALPMQLDFSVWAQSVSNRPSEGVLNWDTYKKLAQPSRTRDVMSYSLGDSNLYTEIVNKYMTGATPSDNSGGSK